MVRSVRDFLKQFDVPLYVASTALGLYLAAGSLLLGSEVPNADFWRASRVPFIMLVASAIWIPLYGLYKSIDAHIEEHDRRRAEVDRDLQVTCQQVAAEIAERCPDVPVNKLSTHIWLCKHDSNFDHRYRFFLPAVRKRSGVVWRKGRGVAGSAWARDEDLFADLRPLHATMRELGREAFDALPPETRYGLTYTELNNTAIYTGVAAIRLFSSDDPNGDSPELLAIFVIDYTGNEHFNCIKEVAQSQAVGTLLGTCEELLTSALRRRI